MGRDAGARMGGGTLTVNYDRYARVQGWLTFEFVSLAESPPGSVERYMPKSSTIRCAASRPEISAVGMPVPGCVLAPTKYRLW